MELIRSSTWRRLAEQPQQWVLGACIAILLWLIGGELWLAARGFSYSAEPATPQSSAPLEIDNPAEQIVAASLFGQAAATATSGPLQETDLQLTLRGVFTASDPGNASAMLELPDGRAQIVRVGGSVAPGTTLQEVFSNHIVLARNGVQESLYFPTPQSSDVATATTEGSVPEATPGLEPADAPPAGASPEEIKRAAILRRLEELRARSSQ